MKSIGTFNSALRIKEEPFDMSLTENNDHEVFDNTSDSNNVQGSSFLRQNPISALRNHYENYEIQLNKDIKIEFECEDVKPDWKLLIANKIDDDSNNHLQDMKYIKSQNVIKTEMGEMVKKECFADEPRCIMDFDRQLGERRETRTVNCERRLKTNMNMTLGGNDNDMDGKKLSTKASLKKINGIHKGITHTCDVCGKKFGRKIDLKTHINLVHNGVKPTCDICEKKFMCKADLKKHIDTIHNGVRHTCDICQKKFMRKGNLKQHIDAMHNGSAHTCDICGQSYTRKDTLKYHIDSMHNGITHTCDLCGKQFSYKCSLKIHVDAVHRGITHACNTCEKKFAKKDDLKIHIDSVHNGITHACAKCGKTFHRKCNLRAHIRVAHRDITRE